MLPVVKQGFGAGISGGVLAADDMEVYKSPGSRNAEAQGYT